ncbi:MAG: RDD family protein [Oscillospiraceae bacterium]|nr:RDD family protein [Oscillospiraceae bacterium]
MPDRPVPPEGYSLRYDNQTGAPLFLNEATGETIAPADWAAAQEKRRAAEQAAVRPVCAPAQDALPVCAPAGTDGAPCGDCVGFIRRFFAFMIDMLVLLLPRCVFWISGAASTLAGGALSEAIFFRFSALDILWYLVVSAYFILTTKCCGATLGKRVLRIRVVRSDGGAPGWWSVIYRETIGRYLTSLLCIGYLVLAADREHRGFHDMLADTRVVYCER